MKNNQSLKAAVDAASGSKKALSNALSSRPAAQPDQRPRQQNRVGKKVITGYFDPAVSKQLRQLGLAEDKTVQDLLAEALNLLFKTKDLPDIA